MRNRKEKMIKIILSGLITLSLGVPVSSWAGESEEASWSSKFSLKTFGISQRFTQQSTFSGFNLSTLPYWSPKYVLYPFLHIEGLLGGTVMRSDVGDFFVPRVQLGVSGHQLFASFFEGKDRLVPELLLGTETWATSEAGTYFVWSLNAHYRFHFESDSWLLRTLDSAYLGFHGFVNSPNSVRQWVIGIRLTPFGTGASAANP